MSSTSYSYKDARMSSASASASAGSNNKATATATASVPSVPAAAPGSASGSSATGGGGAGGTAGGMTRRRNAGDDGDRGYLPATATSTSALEMKLRKLRDDSQKLSQVLTQKLASSQSGQDLLHIGTSLSTLPPDLHSLLSGLHPVLAAAEDAESAISKALTQVVDVAQSVRRERRRCEEAESSANLYADLTAAEAVVASERNYSTNATNASGRRQEQILEKLLNASPSEDGGDDLDDGGGGGSSSSSDEGDALGVAGAEDDGPGGGELYFFLFRFVSCLFVFAAISVWGQVLLFAPANMGNLRDLFRV